jgi:hypothetical protein
MRGAPPVQVACGQDARWRWVIRGLHAVTFASLAGWLAGQFELRLPLLALLVVSVALAAGLLPPAKPPPRAAPVLAWDGQRWLWQGLPAEVAVMLDFDRWLLLRLTTPQGRCWVPLSLSTGDVSAALFKAALKAHAGRASDGDD